METEKSLTAMFKTVWPHLGEREKRLVAASEARRIGRRGITLVSRASGLSRVTITKGIKELGMSPLPTGKTRRSGAGRPRVERADPALWSSLEELMRDNSPSLSEAVLLWTSKSTRKIAQELTGNGHPISHEKVAQILRQNGYSLQGTRKTEEGQIIPDRDAQFRYLASRVNQTLAESQPVLSVEFRKKESGNAPDTRSFNIKKSPRDFIEGPDSIGNLSPAGIFAFSPENGPLEIETGYSPGSFTADSILGWWQSQGEKLFPEAESLMITVDSCWNHRYPHWKTELQKIASIIGLPIESCHLPPGTSKWNKPAHRLFSFTASNWKGTPIRDHEISVRLLGNTAAHTLETELRLNISRFSPQGRPSSEIMSELNLFPAEFHGEWNYVISPAQEKLAAVMP